MFQADFALFAEADLEHRSEEIQDFPWKARFPWKKALERRNQRRSIGSRSSWDSTVQETSALVQWMSSSVLLLISAGGPPPSKQPLTMLLSGQAPHGSISAVSSGATAEEQAVPLDSPPQCIRSEWGGERRKRNRMSRSWQKKAEEKNLFRDSTACPYFLFWGAVYIGFVVFPPFFRWKCAEVKEEEEQEKCNKAGQDTKGHHRLLWRAFCWRGRCAEAASDANHEEKVSRWWWLWRRYFGMNSPI